mmetsp:Transcript_23820/g.43031  ORF Transcript_23820/g.43031 Transcript_23820/m.43031 type:complete len:237 (-) Transcript_23820:225-935(-)
MSEQWARQKEAERAKQIEDGSPIWEACAVLVSKAKVVHFVRHAQATHNEAAAEKGRSVYTDPAFHDARLTDFGKQQCETLKDDASSIGPQVELVLTSPCTRATETALLSFQDHVPDVVKWYALECLREKSGQHPCDNRRSVSELKSDFGHTIDYSFMEDDEDVYGETLGENRETDEMIIARAHEFFAWIKDRPETNIVVVTHSAFLSVLFNQIVKCSFDMSKWFENCEMRTVHFTV